MTRPPNTHPETTPADPSALRPSKTRRKLAMHALADSDPAVRGYAANSLGLLGTSDIAPMLLRSVEREPSAAIRGEIHGALYRLGSTDALSAMLDLLSTDDEDLATHLLNTVEDLVTRRQPAGLSLDAPRLHDALAALERRVPLVAPHAAAIRTKLSAARITSDDE